MTKGSSEKITLGQLETGEYVIASTCSPYFCIVRETEEAAKRAAGAALRFYDMYQKTSRPQARRQTQSVTRIFPEKVFDREDLRVAV